MYQLFDKVRQSRYFSIGGIKRAIKKAVATIARPTDILPRPHAFDVAGMYNPVMFQGGKFPLPEGDSPLNVSAICAFHIESCTTCLSSKIIDLR